MESETVKNIKAYGNKNGIYTPFVNAVFYPLSSQDFVRTGFMTIAPTLAARDYKDPKCILTKGDQKMTELEFVDFRYDEGMRSRQNPQCCPTLTARHLGEESISGQPFVKETVKIKNNTKDGFSEYELGGVADLNYTESKTRRGRVQSGGMVSPTITAEDNAICRIEGIGTKSGKRIVDATILAGYERTNMTGFNDDNGVIEMDNFRIRKLTPRECWRLMDFTDADFSAAEKVNSNTQLYKQAGNSIVKAVLMAIFGQLNIHQEDVKNED